ncbi:zinc transporter ZIP3-like [Diabrotica virgifera virgifera]|uniref:Zinc transporter ZIP3-like n=1 Tax=Diabrotica virgifera virgifera TaxID=50390 RepID=A0A6P7GAS0_DIAVI|nr:zinc transporter ZIP3-like [Diabrotica virgifera virgifera]
MNLVQAKVFSVLSIGVSSFLTGVFPNCFVNQGRSPWPLVLSSLLCFGGGVLLATSLVHILPEVKESLPDNFKKYAELFYCAGFFILYIIDEIIHYAYGNSEDEAASLLHDHGHNNSRRNSYGTIRNETRASRQLSAQSFSRAQSDSALFNEQIADQLSINSQPEPSSSTQTANIGLLVALSVHALLEGLVVGTEAEPTKVLLFLGAICSHKLVVSFCLGVKLASSSSISLQRQFSYILIFSGGSSVGILVGMAASTIHSSVTSYVIPILQALAGGTLLYVTLSEILPKERTKWHQQHEKQLAGIFQLISVAVGFTFMTFLIYYID